MMQWWCHFIGRLIWNSYTTQAPTVFKLLYTTLSFNFWNSKYRSWSHEYVQPGIEFILVWAIVAYMQIDRNLIDRRDSLIDGPLVVWTRDPSSRDSSSYFVLSFISFGVLELFSEGSFTGGSDEACSDLQQGWKNTNIRTQLKNTQKREWSSGDFPPTVSPTQKLKRWFSIGKF